MKKMKNFKYILSSVLVLLLVITGCQEDDPTIGNIIAPTNLHVTAQIAGVDTNNPYGDGSGIVNFAATADNVINYGFVFNGNQQMAPNGSTEIGFTNLGINTYTVTVVAFGTAGNSTSTTIEVEVLATYAPPPELLNTLVGDGSRTWRIKAEAEKHFGLGPVGGTVPSEWFGVGPGEKSSTGMYDDRYIFNTDGTFTHIVNSVNDDPSEDTSGTLFGRDGLIDELGPHNETPNGADIENYPYNDYSENWSLIAPDGVETITLTGLGFIGYYTGGSHRYEIFSRSVPNELLLRTTDGNSEFDWWFIITSEEEENEPTFATIYTNLVWADEFDTNGAPNAANWAYDLGAGGWGNNEVQTYTSDAANSVVEDGSLKIITKKDGSDYTSARLKTQGLYDFTYGRVEVRAKLASGGGTWSAIWMLGSNISTVGWPACGEVDIMEHVGNNEGVTQAAIHTPSSFGGTVNLGNTNTGTTTSEFHLYTAEWTPDKMIFLVDNVVFYTYEPATQDADTWPFTADQFIILNVAMGGSLGGTIDSGFTESTMEIDYVRVYQ